MLQKVNLVPRLKEILDSNYDPKGGYVPDEKKPDTLVLKPWGPDHQPGGTISLNAADYECYTLLCRQVKYKPESEDQELGGGGAMVPVKDLAAALAKTTAETVVEVKVEVVE